MLQRREHSSIGTFDDLLSWLTVLIRESGCVLPKEGACSSVRENQWLAEDALVSGFSNHHILGPLIAVLGRRGTSTVGNGHSFRYILYRACELAFQDAWPKVVAKGGTNNNNFHFTEAASRNLGVTGYFWNDHLQNVVKYEDFQACSSRMMLFHAEVQCPPPFHSVDVQYREVGTKIHAVLRGTCTETDLAWVEKLPSVDELDPILKCAREHVGRAQRSNEASLEGSDFVEVNATDSMSDIIDNLSLSDCEKLIMTGCSDEDLHVLYALIQIVKKACVQAKFLLPERAFRSFCQNVQAGEQKTIHWATHELRIKWFTVLPFGGDLQSMPGVDVADEATRAEYDKFIEFIKADSNASDQGTEDQMTGDRVMGPLRLQLPPNISENLVECAIHFDVDDESYKELHDYPKKFVRFLTQFMTPADIRCLVGNLRAPTTPHSLAKSAPEPFSNPNPRTPELALDDRPNFAHLLNGPPTASSEAPTPDMALQLRYEQQRNAELERKVQALESRAKLERQLGEQRKSPRDLPRPPPDAAVSAIESAGGLEAAERPRNSLILRQKLPPRSRAQAATLVCRAERRRQDRILVGSLFVTTYDAFLKHVYEVADAELQWIVEEYEATLAKISVATSALSEDERGVLRAVSKVYHSRRRNVAREEPPASADDLRRALDDSHLQLYQMNAIAKNDLRNLRKESDLQAAYSMLLREKPNSDLVQIVREYQEAKSRAATRVCLLRDHQQLLCGPEEQHRRIAHRDFVQHGEFTKQQAGDALVRASENGQAGVLWIPAFFAYALESISTGRSLADLVTNVPGLSLKDLKYYLWGAPEGVAERMLDHLIMQPGVGTHKGCGFPVEVAYSHARTQAGTDGDKLNMRVLLRACYKYMRCEHPAIISIGVSREMGCSELLSAAFCAPFTSGKDKGPTHCGSVEVLFDKLECHRGHDIIDVQAAADCPNALAVAVALRPNAWLIVQVLVTNATKETLIRVRRQLVSLHVDIKTQVIVVLRDVSREDTSEQHKMRQYKEAVGLCMEHLLIKPERILDVPRRAENRDDVAAERELMRLLVDLHGIVGDVRKPLHPVEVPPEHSTPSHANYVQKQKQLKLMSGVEVQGIDDSHIDAGTALYDAMMLPEVQWPLGGSRADVLPYSNMEAEWAAELEKKRADPREHSYAQRQKMQLEISTLNTQMTLRRAQLSLSRPVELVLSALEVGDFSLLELYRAVFEAFHETTIQPIEKQLIIAQSELCHLRYRDSSRMLERELTSHERRLACAKEKIGRLIESIEQSRFSMKIDDCYRDIFFAMNSKAPRVSGQTLPHQIAQLLLQGAPVEIIDGDSLKSFLRILLDVFQILQEHGDQFQFITAFGPQSTGKSTLLRFTFGTMNPVSAGRCTRGVTMSIVQLCPGVMGVILDSEGMFSITRKTKLKAFDRHMAIFLMSVCQHVLINVMGELTEQVKDVISVAVYAMQKLKTFKGKRMKPRLLFVLRDMMTSFVPSDDATQPAEQVDQYVVRQLPAMAKVEEELRKACGLANVELNDVVDFNGTQGSIVMMPIAYHTTRGVRATSPRGDDIRTGDFNQSINAAFTEASAQLLKKLSNSPRTEDARWFNDLPTWANFAEETWLHIQSDAALYNVEAIVELIEQDAVMATFEELKLTVNKDWSESVVKMLSEFKHTIESCHRKCEKERMRQNFKIGVDALGAQHLEDLHRRLRDRAGTTESKLRIVESMACKLGLDLIELLKYRANEEACAVISRGTTDENIKGAKEQVRKFAYAIVTAANADAVEAAFAAYWRNLVLIRKDLEEALRSDGEFALEEQAQKVERTFFFVMRITKREWCTHQDIKHVGGVADAPLVKTCDQPSEDWTRHVLDELYGSRRTSDKALSVRERIYKSVVPHKENAPTADTRGDTYQCEQFCRNVHNAIRGMHAFLEKLTASMKDIGPEALTSACAEVDQQFDTYFSSLSLPNHDLNSFFRKVKGQCFGLFFEKLVTRKKALVTLDLEGHLGNFDSEGENIVQELTSLREKGLDDRHKARQFTWKTVRALARCTKEMGTTFKEQLLRHSVSEPKSLCELCEHWIHNPSDKYKATEQYRADVYEYSTNIKAFTRRVFDTHFHEMAMSHASDVHRGRLDHLAAKLKSAASNVELLHKALYAENSSACLAGCELEPQVIKDFLLLLLDVDKPEDTRAIIQKKLQNRPGKSVGAMPPCLQECKLPAEALHFLGGALVFNNSHVFLRALQVTLKNIILILDQLNRSTRWAKLRVWLRARYIFTLDSTDNTGTAAWLSLGQPEDGELKSARGSVHESVKAKAVGCTHTCSYCGAKCKHGLEQHEHHQAIHRCAAYNGFWEFDGDGVSNFLSFTCDSKQMHGSRFLVPQGVLHGAEAPSTIQRMKQYDLAEGKLTFTLTWSDWNDLDLHVVTPMGEHIYYNHRESGCGGKLDHDMNIDGQNGKHLMANGKPLNSDQPVENIFWVNNAPIGTYKVFVRMYKCHYYFWNQTSTFKVRIKNVGPGSVKPGEMCEEYEGKVDSTKEAFVVNYEPGMKFAEHAKKTSPGWRFDAQGDAIGKQTQQMSTFKLIEEKMRRHHNIPARCIKATPQATSNKSN